MKDISGISTQHTPISDRALNSRRRAGAKLTELDKKHDKRRGSKKDRRAKTATDPAQSSSGVTRDLRAGEPQRMAAPTELNGPARVELVSMDQVLVGKSFSPYAHRDIYASKESCIPRKDVSRGGNKGFDSLIADAQMTATACRRSGLREGEGMAQYRLGVLFDNKQDYARAIKAYDIYLKICDETGDTRGASLACNCIGVDHQLLAASVRQVSEADWRAHLDAALQAHRRHLAAADVGGKYVALSNSALVLSALGKHGEAVQRHQKALTIALQLRDVLMQAVAMGNIGHEAQLQGNTEAAQEAIQNHVDLAQRLGDIPSQAKGYQQLGCFANSIGDFEQAIDCFEVSRNLAKANNCAGMAKVAKCHIGAAMGNRKFEAAIANLARQLA